MSDNSGSIIPQGVEAERLSEQLRGFGMSESQITIWWNDPQPALDERSPLDLWLESDRAPIYQLVNTYPRG